MSKLKRLYDSFPTELGMLICTGSMIINWDSGWIGATLGLAHIVLITLISISWIIKYKNTIT